MLNLYGKERYAYLLDGISGTCSMGTIKYVGIKEAADVLKFTRSVKASLKSMGYKTVIWNARQVPEDILDALIEHGWFIANEYRGNHGDKVLSLMINVNQR